MEQRSKFPGSLFRIRYSYSDPLDQHKAQGLIRLAWISIAIMTVGTLGLLFNNATAYSIVQYVSVAVIVIASMVAIIGVINRGNITAASIMFVILTFIVALMSYIPNGPVSMFFVAFSMPVISAGVLLDLRGMIVMIALTLVTILLTVIFTFLGILAPLITGTATLADVLVYGSMILVVDGAILSLFAGGQRIVARQNRALSTELQSSAGFTRTVADGTTIDELLTQTTNLIRDRFGYYFVQIFMLEAKTGLLVLQSGTGMSAGQRRIAPDEKTVINEVTRSGKTRRIGENAPAGERTEFLAATRAELLVPLRRGKQIFGILDVQSVSSNAFTEADIDALQVIVSQVSLAVDNTRLVNSAQESSVTQQRLTEQLQSATRQIAQLNQVGSGQSWSHFLESRTEGSIGLDWKDGIFTQNQTLTPALERGMSSATPEIRFEGGEQVMTVPILSRGQILGVMEFRTAGKRTWNNRSLELARAISQRLALALDNVRLFEQAQAVATREQTVNRIAAQLQANTDVDSLLTTAAESFQQALGATRTSIRLGTSDQIGGKNGGSKS